MEQLLRSDEVYGKNTESAYTNPVSSVIHYACYHRQNTDMDGNFSLEHHSNLASWSFLL
jgi:hypothetical protein